MNGRSNDVAAGEKSKFRGNQLACMDRLPVALRRFLHEAVVDWSVLEIRWLLNKAINRGVPEQQAITERLEDLQFAQERELKRFAYCWPSRFGPHPATAAAATPMRYLERDIQRRRK